MIYSIERPGGILQPVDEKGAVWRFLPKNEPDIKPLFFANKSIVASLDDDLLKQVAETAEIPNLMHLGYTADVHVGHGTAIGTTMAAHLDDEPLISCSTVGVDIGCGISIMLTPLQAADLGGKPQLRQFIQEVEKLIKPGEGEKNNLKIDETELWTAVVHGLPHLGGRLAELSGVELDLDYVEDAALDAHELAKPFAIAGGDKEWRRPGAAISDKAWQRTVQTVGTLGGGNHFCEVQVLRVLPGKEELAAAWGLQNGQVAVMLHSGSRGGGHQIATDYERLMKAEMNKLKLPRPNKEVTFVPLHSPLGATYLFAQAVALNISRINRLLMRAFIRRALSSVYRVEGREVRLLYDIAHNYASLERDERLGRYLIHRKGATRALPPGHADNPPVYRQTGHPVLIPGSMGANSRSYILVGRESGRENLFTVNHGAGRSMSRREARDNITLEDFTRSLTYTEEDLAQLPFTMPVDEVMVNKRRLMQVVDEAPAAYKDADAVIDSVVGAGLAEVVAVCYPVAVIKG